MYLGYQYYSTDDSLVATNGSFLFSYGLYGVQVFGTELEVIETILLKQL
jgi:hypothetical protein